MKKIIDPVPLSLIKAELTPERKLMDTNKGGNELYIVDCNNAPNTLREIGRIRELTYRAAGSCSGNEIDLDEYDFLPKPYQQLIVWDPDAQAIIGGYRFLEKHFPDEEELIRPYKPLRSRTDNRLLDLVLSGEGLHEDLRCLKKALHQLGTNIPPLVNSYQFIIDRIMLPL